MSHQTKARVLLLGIASVFCLCCSGTAGPPRLEIAFVQSWADDVNPEFRALVGTWARRRGVIADVEIMPIRDLDLKSTAWVQAPHGDIALLPSNIAMVNTRKLRDITNLAREVSSGRPAGYYTIGAAMAQFGGRWFNVPFCAWPHVWFYRGDLLDTIGASIPKTYAEAADLARRLTRPADGVYGLGIGLGQDEDISMFLEALLWAHGASVVDRDGRTVRLDSDATEAAANYLLQLYRAGAIPPGALAWDGATNNNLFLGRKIAITANALSIDYVAKRKDPQLYATIRHSVYPAGPAGQFAFVQTFGWAIKNSSQNALLADDFLRFLYDNGRLRHLFATGEGAIAPLVRSIGDTPPWTGGPYQVAIESVRAARPLGWPGPFTREAAEVFNRRIVNEIFARVINDRVPVRMAIREATAKVAAIYHNAK